MKPVGEKIKQIRKSKGISQTVVADICGIKQSSYANIESGKTQTISIEVGKGIAKALKVSFYELFEIPDSNASNEEGSKFQKLQKENEDLKTRISEKNSLIDVLKRENFELWKEKLRKKIKDHLFFWLEDEKKIRQSNSTSDNSDYEGLQEIWVNDIKSYISFALENKFLTIDEIFEDLTYNVELIELLEEDSNSINEFIANFTKFLNQLIPISEKEVQTLLNKNKGFKKTLPFKDKF